MTSRDRQDSRRAALNERIDRELRAETKERSQFLQPVVDRAVDGDLSSKELLAREDRRSRDNLIGHLLDKAHDLKAQGDKERASVCFDTAIDLARVA